MQDTFILVGFGDFTLLDLVEEKENIDLDALMLASVMTLPPRFKKTRACTIAEMEAAVKCRDWIHKIIDIQEEIDE